MATRILALNANPRVGSFTDALTDAYTSAATAAGADVTTLAVRDLAFDPALHGGYTTVTPLEPDLVRFQELMRDCDHFTVLTPLWWNSIPAPLKGLIDRALLPGFGFNYTEGKPLPERLLGGRRARIVISSDSPLIYQLTYAGDTAVRMLKRNTIAFCGFKPVHVTRLSPIRSSSDSRRASYLEKVRAVGTKDGSLSVSDERRASRKPVTIGGRGSNVKH